MSTHVQPKRILFVTGMSGAGKSTALDTLEDLGWEVVDNLPLRLLDRLLDVPAAKGMADHDRPLAIGIDSRTRGFDPTRIIARVRKLREQGTDIETLFLDCGAAEIERRYSETRRRHPLALDRPARDGIVREREVLAPLRRWADHVIDTTDSNSSELKREIRERFADAGDAGTTLAVMSFGYARGVPRNADLVFDMRFLRNPHWETDLRPLTGLDERVGRHVEADESYEEAMERIEELLLLLLPRYSAEGKPYVTVAFGCTGGRHRSVHCAERVAKRLREAGFSPTVAHRDLESAPKDAIEERPTRGRRAP